jgi:hypothetical protein
MALLFPHAPAVRIDVKNAINIDFVFFPKVKIVV